MAPFKELCGFFFLYTNIIKTIVVITETASDGTVSAYCKDEMFSGMGESKTEAIENLKEQIEIYHEFSKEQNMIYPLWLDNDYQLKIL